jgi:hypothetical protein
MPQMSLKQTMDRLLLLIRSGYPVLYIVSHEESRVLDYIAKLLRVIHAENPKKALLRWDQGNGFELLRDDLPPPAAEDPPDWLALEGLPSANWQLYGGRIPPWDALDRLRDASTDPVLANSVTVFLDLHPHLRPDAAQLGAEPLVRLLRNTAARLRDLYDTNRAGGSPDYQTLIVIAPSAENLSAELERDLIKIDFPLPETTELRRTLARMLPEDDAKLLTNQSGLGTGQLSFLADPSPEERAAVSEADDPAGYRKQLGGMIAGAGRGLTLAEYQRGLSMFAVRREPLRALNVEDMLHLKAKAISNQALEYTPHVDIELGGLSAVKEWIRTRRDAAVNEELRGQWCLPAPKGVMLCGVSGGGKSQLAKLIAKEFNLALLRLDVGALFGSYIGESERQTREALRMAEVLAPVVLWLDEVDKAFTGMQAGGDNGVSARVFGHFLTWLSEKQDSIFVVTTANDFDKLLKPYPEFGRKGRFDEIFWVGLPGEEARQAIFEIYLRRLPEDRVVVTDEDVDRLAKGAGADPPAPNPPLDRFCALLSNRRLSNNLTGAEIEYAVNEALYEAHKERSERLTPDTLVRTVSAAMQRALYNPSSQMFATMTALEQAAKQNHWIEAERGEW